MTDLKLPELPEPSAFAVVSRGRSGATDFYRAPAAEHARWLADACEAELRGLHTDEAMRAYATAAVLAERAAAEADARRYRWLRDRAGMGFIATLNMRRESDEWDGEIDAAMAAAEEWNAGIDAAIQESHDDAR